MGVESTDKLKINGIKLSEELVQINLTPEADISPARLFHKLAVRRINLSLVVVGATGDRLNSACCIAADELPRAKSVIDQVSGGLQVITSVGSLTVYPHRTRFDLLECVLAGFGRRRLPVYAIASSLAALTVTTDYGRIEEAVAAVEEETTLPHNHAPLYPEFKVRQI